MDTRKKIVDEAKLYTVPGRICLARGWFDVLTAEHGKLLGDAKAGHGTLVALVYRDTPSRPAPLVASDRAQMIAALESVDLVCKCDGSRVKSITDALRPEAEIDVDALQSRNLVQDVLERHAQL